MFSIKKLLLMVLFALKANLASGVRNFQAGFSRIKALFFTSAVTLVGMAAANATSVLPSAATDAMTLVESGATEIITWMWSVGVIVTVGFLTFKLFKRGGNKAT